MGQVTTIRSEVEDLIRQGSEGGDYGPGGPVDCVSVEKAAGLILAAGYRKIRTATTEEDLDSLPVGSVILMAKGRIAMKMRAPDSWWVSHESWDRPFTYPAAILWEPWS